MQALALHQRDEIVDLSTAPFTCTVKMQVVVIARGIGRGVRHSRVADGNDAAIARTARDAGHEQLV